MVTTIQTTNLVGAGVQFTFALADDAFVILQGVTVGSTTANAINFANLANVSLDIGGTLVSRDLVTSGSGTNITVGAAGRIVATQTSSANASVFLSGDDSVFDNAGELVAAQSIGFMSNGGNDIINSGRISAVSGVFLGLFGGTGDTLINSGIISASRIDDAIRNTRFNNAVFAEGTNTRIVNSAGGLLAAVSSEGAGVRLGSGADGSSITNDGTITATTWFGVDFSEMAASEAGRLVNAGTIRGGQGSYNGNDSADTIFNRGAMIGQVLLGDGADVFDGRRGQLEGGIDGGNGSDRIDLRGAVAVEGDLVGGTGADTVLGSDWAESIFGNDDGDDLRGYGGDDTMNGGLGIDVMFGGAGNDQLFGGDDIDALFGGDGDDTLDGGDGFAQASGGAGDDTMFIGTAFTAKYLGAYGDAGDDTITGGGEADNVYGGAGNDVISTLNGFDIVFGGDGSDQLILDTGADFGSGGQGDDTLSGGTSIDTLSGDAGNDVLFGGTENDSLNGGLGDDQLEGDGGRDAMIGGAGNDTLIGGAQRDLMTGGTGADVFLFKSQTETGRAASSADIIRDFRLGEDVIDLSLIDARADVAGDQAFRFVGSAGLSGGSGSLRYDASTGLVQGDITGDGRADFAIVIVNKAALTALDFVL